MDGDIMTVLSPNNVDALIYLKISCHCGGLPDLSLNKKVDSFLLEPVRVEAACLKTCTALSHCFAPTTSVHFPLPGIYSQSGSKRRLSQGGGKKAPRTSRRRAGKPTWTVCVCRIEAQN